MLKFLVPAVGAAVAMGADLVVQPPEAIGHVDVLGGAVLALQLVLVQMIWKHGRKLGQLSADLGSCARKEAVERELGALGADLRDHVGELVSKVHERVDRHLEQGGTA